MIGVIIKRHYGANDDPVFRQIMQSGSVPLASALDLVNFMFFNRNSTKCTITELVINAADPNAVTITYGYELTSGARQINFVSQDSEEYWYSYRFTAPTSSTDDHDLMRLLDMVFAYAKAWPDELCSPELKAQIMATA